MDAGGTGAEIGSGDGAGGEGDEDGGAGGEGGRVGLDDMNQAGFAVGVAASANKPLGDDDGGVSGVADGAEGGGMSTDEMRSRTPRKGKIRKDDDNLVVPDKNSTFIVWKQGQGSSYEQRFQSLKGELVNRKTKCRQLINQLNAKKHFIDSLREQQEKRQAHLKATSSNQPGVIDEEEYELLHRQQNERQAYKQMLSSKQQLDGEIVRGEEEIQSCKTELVRAFESWYAHRYKDGLANLQNRAGALGGAGGGGGFVGDLSNMDTREAYDQLETQRFQGDTEAYAYYQAKKTAKGTKKR